MTLDTFCKRTGWPREDFRNLPVTEVIEIGRLYDLELVIMVKLNGKWVRL